MTRSKLVLLLHVDVKGAKEANTHIGAACTSGARFEEQLRWGSTHRDSGIHEKKQWDPGCAKLIGTAAL